MQSKALDKSVLAGIFMVELERNVIPTLSDHITGWKRYVDDTIGYVKVSSVDLVKSKLMRFIQKYSSLHENEENNRIHFWMY